MAMDVDVDRILGRARRPDNSLRGFAPLFLTSWRLI